MGNYILQRYVELMNVVRIQDRAVFLSIKQSVTDSYYNISTKTLIDILWLFSNHKKDEFDLVQLIGNISRSIRAKRPAQSRPRH